MQRSFILGGPDGNTLIISPSSTNPIYGPFGGIQPSDNASEAGAILGNGCYSTLAFSGVISRLTMFVGYINTAIAVTAAVNVGGTATPGAGAQSVSCPSTVQNTNSYYYYDATHIDALVAGQNCGLQLTPDRSGSGQISISHVNAVCDSPNSSWSMSMMWDAAGYFIYNASRHYSPVVGDLTQPATGTPQATQGYTAQSFVASYLQWQTLTGNTDTALTCTCNFSWGSTFGSTVDTNLSALIAQVASYVGAQYDTTHVAAVPAGSYLTSHWTGGASGNTLKVANAGMSIQPTSSNATFLCSGGPSNAWNSGYATQYTPLSGPRFDYGANEMGCPIPTAGVFSNLAVQISVYTNPTTFTIQTCTCTDAGAGVGGPITSAASYSNTPISLSFNGVTAPCWAFDLTHVAAFTPTETMLLAATATTSGGVSIQTSSINFTAPAHLGLLTRGAG